MKRKIIWSHPAGRFDVIETTGRDMFGCEYRVREAVLTPQKDRRGIAQDDQPREQMPMKKPKKSKTVSPADKSYILRLHKVGKTAREICALTGLSDTSIYRVLCESGARTPVQRPRWTEKERQMLHDMREAGWPAEKIAAALGRSVCAVRTEAYR